MKAGVVWELWKEVLIPQWVGGGEAKERSQGMMSCTLSSPVKGHPGEAEAERGWDRGERQWKVLLEFWE